MRLTGTEWIKPKYDEQKEATKMTDHKAEDMKGRVKEAAGDITGDKGLQREGKMDQASAATKKQIDKATDKIKEVVHPKS